MMRGSSRADGVPLRSSLILVSVVFAALAFRLVRLTERYAVNIFFWDQWDINDATLFQYHSLWEIFRWQHGPHRQGLGGLLAILVEPWFDWNSRTEAFLATGLVVIAALCALYLKYRLFGSLSWTDLVIPIIILSPAQWDSLWTTVNLSHGVLPLLLVILYCLVWTWRHERAKFALITVLNFLILYTGFGLFIGFLTPVLLIATYRGGHNKTAAAKTYLVFSMIASVVSMASFFVGYRSDPSSGCSSLFSPSPVQYFWFMDLMYAHPFGVRGIGLIPRFTGAIVFASVAAVAVAGWKQVFGNSGGHRALNLVPAVLSTYSILFCVSAALGRTCIGLFAAHASRYSNYMQLGILSLYLCALAVGRSRLAMALSTVLLISLLPSLVVSPSDTRGMQMFSSRKAAWRTCYLGGHDIADCDRAFGAVHPLPDTTHLKEKLDYLQATEQNLFSDSRRDDWPGRP